MTVHDQNAVSIVALSTTTWIGHKYMFMSHYRTAGQNHNMKVVNKSFENTWKGQVSQYIP